MIPRPGLLAVGILALCGQSLQAQSRTTSSDPDVMTTLESLLDLPVSAAAKHEQTMREAPASATVITSEDIEKYGYQTLAEALIQLRGFYGTYDREYTYLGTRGFGRPSDYNTRVQVQVDGHVLNEAFYSSALLGTGFGLSLEGIDRIEVIRGPGSALHGGNALFAVVNVITKKGAQQDGISVSGDVGSHGHRRSTLTLGRRHDSGFDAFVSASWYDRKGEDLYFSSFDGPGGGDGIAEGMDWDRSFGAHGSFSYESLTFSFFGASRAKGVSTAPWGSKFNETPARRSDDRVFGEVRLDEKLGPNRRLRVRGYLDYYDSKRSHSFPMPWLLTRFTSKARWAGMEAHLLEDLSPAHRMTLGAEYRDHFRAGFRLFSFGEIRTDENYPFSLTSAFVQHEWQARRDLALTGGMRLDHYSNFGTAFSPRLALVYHPGEKNTLKLLYGEGFRPPNLWELNYRVPTVVKPNPELDPERIRTYEAVFERRLTEWATGVVSVFRNEIDGLISSVLDPSDGLTQFQNREDTEVLGVEWEVQARTSSGFQAYASLILQEPENSGTGELLANAPKNQARAGLRYPILTWLTAAGSVLHDGKRKTVRGEETEAYSLANLHLTADILGEMLQVSLGIRNLFDSQYWMPVSLQHRQESVEQDGRSLILSLQARF